MVGLRGVPATWGGVERHVEEIGARLVARGHEVTVFCRPGYCDSGGGLHRGMRTRTLATVEGRGVEALVHSANAALRTLGRRYDVVHFHAVGPGLAAPLPRMLSNAAVVQTIHGLDADREKWSGFGRAALRVGTWMSARVPDVTVTVSRALQDHYREIYGRDTVYVPNGALPGRRVDARHLRERFGLEPGGYLLYVGRLVPEKAADVLLEAYAGLEGDVRLVVAGDSSHTDDFAAHVRALAARDPRVVLPGYVHGDDLAALYTHARSFVLPSRLEGLPLTLLEAAGYELPLVVSSIPPHLEVVGGADRPGVRIARPASVGDLRDALARSLAGGDAERVSAAANAARVLEHYDWDRAASLLEEVYLAAAPSTRVLT